MYRALIIHRLTAARGTGCFSKQLNFTQMEGKQLDPGVEHVLE
jgi:hypothetical protein